MTNLAELVRAAAAARPDHPAYVSRTEVLTWGQVDQRVDRAARALTERSLAPGDRVAILLNNRPEMAIFYWAILRAGLVAVPLNPALTAHEVSRLVTESGARLLLHETATTRAASMKAAALEKRNSDVEVIALGSDAGQELVGAGRSTRGAFAGPRTTDRELAVLMFTSGSEGSPKGAMLSHGALRSNVAAVAKLRRPPALTQDDRLLIVLPLSHIYGLNAGLGLAAQVGATSVLLNRFDPRESLQLIRERDVTVIVGAPSMYVAWSAEGSLREATDGVRLFISGAAPLPPAVFQQFRTITGKPIWEGYGLTETSPVVTSALASKAARPGSVGRPISGVQVSLRDVDGRDVREGDPGEVCVKSKGLLSGYWPDGAPAVDADGWFHTGDIAILDEDGDYRLVDRRKDVILVSGFNVYPREVEQVLLEHPAVAEAAVVGVPHPLTGETVKAVVVLSKGVPEPDDLRAFCEARLARFKCPSIVEFVSRLPRAASGKITRRRLRDARP